MADDSQASVRRARGGKIFGGRFGEAGDDMKKVAERHAAAIAQSGACQSPEVAARPWVERLGRHFLLGRQRAGE